MGHRSGAFCAALVVLSTLTSAVWGGTTRTPAELVQSALAAEAAGGNHQAMGPLLEQALKLDANYAPARWALGYVQWNGAWVKLDEVARLASSDARLTAYRQRRDALVDTAAAHKDLARWCRKQKLVDEERLHWAKALEFDLTDAEAIKALGLQLYEGKLLSRRQIDVAKRQATDRLQAYRSWQPKIAKWRKGLESRSESERQSAEQAILEINDPQAIAALEAGLTVDSRNKHANTLNLLLVEVLAGIQHPEATQALLRRAVLSDSLEVRKAAAAALKRRPMHAYVPQLIAAIPGNIKTQYQVYFQPGGLVYHEHQVVLEGRQHDVTYDYVSVMQPGNGPSALRQAPLVLGAEMQLSDAVERDAAAAQDRLDKLRDRVACALRQSTGFENASDPRLWQRMYDDYYGWQTPETAKQVYRNESAQYLGGVAPLRPAHSCFPPGTPVLTLYGTRPIEELRVGDRVLSQDATSGELLYTPIQATTLRPPKSLVKVTTSSGSLTTTPGHPLWVAGSGWRTAKNLSQGDLLYGLKQVVRVEQVEEMRPTEVYNLVLSEHHNYFAGELQLLVHDNSPLEETTSVVPGLARSVTEAARE